MKTQISDLINGNQNTIRDDSHPKYKTAEKATTYAGKVGPNYVGTNSHERELVAKKVYEENPEVLRISVKGVELELPIEKSVSGKSWMWTTNLTQKQYDAICGF